VQPVQPEVAPIGAVERGLAPDDFRGTVQGRAGFGGFAGPLQCHGQVLEISAVSVRVAKSRVLACLRRELGAVIS
jgi:hypothetical protein